MEKSVKVEICLHLSEAKLLKKMEELIGKEALDNLDKNKSIQDRVVFLAGYYFRTIAGEISVNNNYTVEHSVSEFDAVGWSDVTHMCSRYQGYKVIEITDVYHPKIIAIALDGSKAIAFSEDVDASSVNFFYRYSEIDDSDEPFEEFHTVDEALEYQLKNSEFEINLMDRTESEGTVTFIPDSTWSLDPNFKITLDIKSGDIAVTWI